MAIEITLTRGCGCVDRWLWDGPQIPFDEVQHMQGAQVCLPEQCQACIARGEPCEARTSTYLYPMDPMTWSDEAPRRRFTRRKLA